MADPDKVLAAIDHALGACLADGCETPIPIDGVSLDYCSPECQYRTMARMVGAEPAPGLDIPLPPAETDGRAINAAVNDWAERTAEHPPVDPGSGRSAARVRSGDVPATFRHTVPAGTQVESDAPVRIMWAPLADPDSPEAAQPTDGVDLTPYPAPPPQSVQIGRVTAITDGHGGVEIHGIIDEGQDQEVTLGFDGAHPDGPFTAFANGGHVSAEEDQQASTERTAPNPAPRMGGTDWQELRESVVRRVAGAFGVPPAVAGLDEPPAQFRRLYLNLPIPARHVGFHRSVAALDLTADRYRALEWFGPAALAARRSMQFAAIQIADAGHLSVAEAEEAFLHALGAPPPAPEPATGDEFRRRALEARQNRGTGPAPRRRRQPRDHGNWRNQQ